MSLFHPGSEGAVPTGMGSQGQVVGQGGHTLIFLFLPCHQMVSPAEVQGSATFGVFPKCRIHLDDRNESQPQGWLPFFILSFYVVATV